MNEIGPEAARRAARGFRAAFDGDPEVVAWAPGRINVLGEHTDYNAGLALPAAIDRWTAVALRRADTPGLRVVAGDLDERWEASPGEVGEGWRRYVGGVLRVWEAEVGPLGRGLEAWFGGDVPRGAGVSSSAALLMAWLEGVDALWGAAVSAARRVGLAQAVERDHVGVACGTLDFMASQHAAAGRALRIDFRSDSWSVVDVDLPGWTWAVVDSGVRRELASSGYDTRVAECRAGVAALGVTDARAVTLDALEGHDAVWAQRLRHVVTENARVEAGVRALTVGDAEALGALLSASHASLRDLYAVSCAEVDRLVALLEAEPGCAGARIMGGGFGGCALALLQTDQADAALGRVAQAYRAEVPAGGQSWQVRLVEGAGHARQG